MHVLDKSSDIVFQDRPRGSGACKHYNFPFGLFLFIGTLSPKVHGEGVGDHKPMRAGNHIGLPNADSAAMYLFSADCDKTNSC